MYDSIQHRLAEFLSDGDTVVTGVSGGPDSMSLLDCLARFSRERELHIVVAHVNHGLRGGASDKDEKFVRSRCADYGVTFKSKKVELEGDSNLEMQGRKARRIFFESLADDFFAPYILTAHTQDDQLETIFFNFLRGSGPRGLSGMKYQNGRYFKPMLNISRKEVMQYIKKRELEYRVDESNDDTRFRRNFLRHEVLPLFEKINPAWRETVLRNTEIFSSVDSFIEAEAEMFLREHRSLNSFPRDEFFTKSKPVQTGIINQIYQDVIGSSYKLPYVKTQEVLGMIEKGVGGKEIACNKGGRFVLEKGVISFHN